MEDPRYEQQIAKASERLLEQYPDEREQVAEAIALAREWHAPKRRRSGEPFVLHPLAVAEILAAQGLSAETVIAALLHDVLEDTECPPELISDRFGPDVFALVDGVTKIQRIAPRGSKKREKLDTYRKLLLAASDDARVLVIKLADRLHNIRTIGALAPARAQAIARETLDVYAPLAHRLGMSLIREELEDLSLAVLDKRAFDEAGIVQKQRAGSEASQVTEMIEALREALATAGIEAQVYSRVKSRFSIAEKLKRRSRDDIWDVVGVRVIVTDPDDCYRVLGIVHNLWPPRFDRFKDFIAVPKENLYQSLHTTVNAAGRPVEFQIRTRDQHRLAEHGIAAHWMYKETLRSGGPAGTRSFIERAAAHQQHAPDLEEAFQQLKHDVFLEEIYLFTPGGDVVVLPAGACAIDFAYAIHTELGHSCVGARIDGELRPLTRPLRNGEVVEIMTGRKSQPSRDWLEAVKTSRARARIRQFHQAEIEREQTSQGLRRLGQALRSAGMGPLANPERLTEALRDAGYVPEQTAMEIARDESRIKPVVSRLVRLIAGAPAAEPEPELVTRPRLAQNAESAIKVEGLDGVPVRLAGCCAPEPGDPITGYVSMGRGVIVHHSTCANLRQQREQASPRLLEVSWSGLPSQSFRSELELAFLDQPKLLLEIAAAVTDAGCELEELDLKRQGKVVRGRAVAIVSSPDQSSQLRQLLSEIEGALRVRRSAEAQARS